MCEVTSEGYKMDDGTFIRFDDDLKSVSPNHIQEMSKHSITAYDGFLIHQSIVCLERKIIPALSKIDLHTKDCPVNKNGVRGMILEELKKAGKKKYDNFLSKIRDISVIIAMISGIILIIKNL